MNHTAYFRMVFINIAVENSENQKEGIGCGTIAAIFFVCFIGIGIFTVLAVKYLGEEMKGFIFFGSGMLLILVFVGRELLTKKKRPD